MEKHKKHLKRAHENLVGIFAAAFAVTVIIATQIGGSDSLKFAADMTTDCAAAGGSWNGTMCNMPSSGGSSSCTSGQYWNGSACVANTAPTCPSGQTWNGSMCAGNSTPAPTCTSPMYLDSATNTCVNPPAPTCTAPMVLDSSTNTCVNNTTATTCTGGQWMCGNGQCSVNNLCPTTDTTTTCTSGQYWSGSACVNSSSANTGASSYITAATCNGANYFWSSTKNWCYSTQAEKSAGESSTAGSWPTKSVQWNANGVTSMVCDNAPQAEIDARKLIVKDLTNAQVQWLNGSNCASTSPDRAGFPSKGSSTTTTGSCGGGMYWDSVTNACKANTVTTSCTSGQYWNGSYCQSDTMNACTDRGGKWIASGQNGQCSIAPVGGITYINELNKYVTEPTCTAAKGYWSNNFCYASKEMVPGSINTVGQIGPEECRTKGLFWGPKSNWCFNTKLEFDRGENWTGTDTNSDGKSSCTRDGGFWVESTAAGARGYCKWDTDRPAVVDTIESCKRRGMGWDAARSMCLMENNVKEYDRYMNMEEGCRSAGGAWVSGANSFTAMGGANTGYCKMPVDLRSVNDMNARMKAECVAKKGSWNPGPTETATGWCRMEQLEFDHDGEDCGENAYWDFNMQGCQTRGRRDFSRDKGMDREAMRMSAMFSNQLSYISRDIEDSRYRAEDAAAEGADVSEALSYLDKADELVANMMENIQEIASSEDPRTWFEPECMSSFANSRSFGDRPERICTIEEALEGDTPRGYIYAANTLMDDEQRNFWESKMCTEISKHMSEFQRMFAKSKAYKAEVEDLLVDGNRLVSACEDAEDKSTIMPAMDALRMRAESLMRRSSTKNVDPAYGLKFSGVDQQMDEATFNRVVALIEQKVTERLTRVIEERMTALTANMDAGTLSKVTQMFTAVKADIAEKLSLSFENAAVFAASAPDAVNKQQGYTVDIINTLKTIETVYPDRADEVEKAREVIASRPWPVSTLAEYKEGVDRALAIANDGDDPVKDLEEIIRDGGGANEREINEQLSRDGLWAFPDVNHNVWYAASANEAATLGVVQGTENAEGYKDLRPEVQLNCAEGIAMNYKAAGLSLPSETDEAARTLAGNVGWSEPFLQGAINIIGEDGVKAIINRCGGIGGAMRRDAFAHLAVQMYEKISGESVDVDVDAEIGSSYADFNEMNDEQKLDFAKAHKLGIITGAEGGTKANFEGFVNRAEAAKMLTVLNKVLAAVQVVAGADFPSPTGN